MKLQEKNLHIFFLLIISINYLFPLIFFGKVTTFYHDNLDSMVVYNHVIGKIYREGFNFANSEIFLAGEIKYYYLRHIFKPFLLLYSFLSTEIAYWITNTVFKLTCYFCFFLLSKKITNNLLISFVGATLFSCLPTFTTLGFGLAIFPYMLYLVIFRSNLKLKHYFLLILFGLNTDLVSDFFFIPIFLLIIFIIDKQIFIQKFSAILKILSIFFICSVITSSNIIFVQLFSEPMHRTEFANQPQSILINLFTNVLGIIKAPTGLNWTFFKLLPYTIILTPLIILSIFTKEKIIRKFLIFIFFIQLFSFSLNTELISNLINSWNNFFKTFNLLWISYYLPVIHSLLFIYLSTILKKKSKFLVFTGLVAIFLFQINSSAVPLIKKNILKEENYRNIYTFNDYYLYEDYSKIKKIVKDNRVISVGLDPLVAVMNNISVIDGYHSLYPLSYKKKFRGVIEEELKTNSELRNYYDNWGSRVYAFNTNPNRILINFEHAKKLGADYVISRDKIISDKLSLMCKNCSNSLILYKIK